MNSFGPAEVKAYFHADGFLGVICQPDTMPERLQRHGVTLGHFFGQELEPYTPGPAAPAQQRRDPDEAGFEQAHLANGYDPTINRADDWIPDYPASADEAQPD